MTCLARFQNTLIRPMRSSVMLEARPMETSVYMVVSPRSKLAFSCPQPPSGEKYRRDTALSKESRLRRTAFRMLADSKGHDHPPASPAGVAGQFCGGTRGMGY